MSALAPSRVSRDTATEDSRPGADQRHLQPVPKPPERLERVPFLGVLIALFGLGMAGLLMLNTSLQNQAFESRALERRATELAYEQAALETQISAVSAPQELARRASRLGMRANPYAAFLVVPSGKVIGKPKRVKGDEAPLLVVKTAEQRAAARAQREAKQKAQAAKQQQAATQRAAAARAVALKERQRQVAAQAAQQAAAKRASR